MVVSLQLEIVNLPPFDLDGAHYERTSLVDKELLVREWGGNIVAQYLQSGRLRVAHPDAHRYRDDEMFGEHARILVSGGVEAFGPGVGSRIHENLQPSEAPPLPEGGQAGSDEVFDPFTATAPEVKAYVEEHPSEATAVLSQELTGKARKGLVAWLQEQVGEQADADPDPDPDDDDRDGDDDDDLLPPAAVVDEDDDFVVAQD